ncbi:EamA family transporter RarD [Luteococcus sanguinis]|uniref:EamA family transporter RarD n=1 Tax=Luteococcus sanguinis TaxID=174038 RepID=A0ABW1X4W0_9ACTN
MPRTSQQTSLLAGIGCYLIWGFFPLFFPLLKPAGALEILSHRVLWSAVFVIIVLLVLRRDWGWLRAARSQFWTLALAAVLIGGNWLTYIWAVNTSHVVEASLGYFINPLVSILFGMLIFGERMSRAGAIGCLLALAGVCVIAAENWRTLGISLALAFSFGAYGAVKKKARLGALEGLLAESAILAPLALAWVASLAVKGQSVFGASLRSTLLLMLAGILTAVPLWLFATAAPGIPLGTLGVLQYMTPTMQFLMGLFIFGQHVGASYWFGLVLVWLGSIVYLAWAVRTARVAHKTI